MDEANGSNAVPNACSCEICRGACSHKPGWFVPDQIPALASALGITEKELFDRHLQVDWWTGSEETDWEDVFVLSPAIIGGRPGTMFGRNPRGRCAWLVDGKCSIHELGKPFECAAYHHSEHESEEGKLAGSARHGETAMAWHTPDAQAKVRDLLGYEPSTEDFSIFDMIGMWR